MTTAVSYYLRLLAYRQSAIPPVLLYLALLGMIFASDAGPAVPAATATAVALMPLCAWLMRLCAVSEARPFADITAVALGGVTRRLAVRALAASSVGVGLAAIAVAWSVIVNPHPYPAATVLIIVGMHLAQVIAGVGVGALVSPPLRVTPGAAVLAIAALVLVSLLVRWVPPLGPMLYNLDRTPVPSPMTLLVTIGQAAILGTAALALAALRGSSAR